jgi:hypothetical protein
MPKNKEEIIIKRTKKKNETYWCMYIHIYAYACIDTQYEFLKDAQRIEAM